MLTTLTSAQVRPSTNPEEVLACVAFDTTRALPPSANTIGQERAEEAMRFGTRIKAEGYHIFAMGPRGINKRSLVHALVEPVAATMPLPADWLYVQGFGHDQRPQALGLQAGQGRRLVADLDRLLADLPELVNQVLTDDNFKRQVKSLGAAFQQRQEQDFAALQEDAKAHNLMVLQNKDGLSFVPLDGKGEMLDQAAVEALTAADQTRIQEAVTSLLASMSERMEDLPAEKRTLMGKQRKLLAEHIGRTVQEAMGPLRNRYQAWPEVMQHLNRLRDDVVAHAQVILAMNAEPGATLAPKSPEGVAWQRFWDRYRGNLLVDHANNSSAPVVFESNPTVENLVGRQEHRTEMGNLVTDFNLIRPGALHRANGGFLVLDAERLLSRPFSWDALKRALEEGEIRMESTAQWLGTGSVVNLEPEPIPLQVKVVLLGDRRTWMLLSAADPAFATLFRVAADFVDHIPRNHEQLCNYINLLATLAQEAKLLPLDPGAVAAVVDHGRRLVGDQERLLAATLPLADLMVEADFVARDAGLATISAKEVQAAIEQSSRRLERSRDAVHEQIQDGTVHIQTEGTATGQINGLAVLQVGGLRFGQPSRISATARVGKGQLLDIEREAEMGGSLHSKAVLIVHSFIASRYAREQPLSLAASLVFEQSYGGVDGDSASVAEVCALLSAIAGLPLRQDVAITGSMDQHGRVQAIGGANEKIEGFFDICHGRGLSGSQGCLLPASNLRHLMLRPDVAEAVAAGQFHIWTMEHIDDALGLLTGRPAGSQAADGSWTPDSSNAAVAASLAEFTRLAPADNSSNSGP